MRPNPEAMDKAICVIHAEGTCEVIGVWLSLRNVFTSRTEKR